MRGREDAFFSILRLPSIIDVERNIKCRLITENSPETVTSSFMSFIYLTVPGMALR